MSHVIVHLSNIHNSSISFGRTATFENGQSEEMELLLESLEINRNLIAGISSQWDCEEDLFKIIQGLIDQQKRIELKVSKLISL